MAQKSTNLENIFISYRFPVIGHKTDCDVIFPMEDYSCNNSEYRSCKAKLSSGDI